MILALLLLPLVLVYALVRLRKRGHRKVMLREPLAGYDTGCRFPRRTPGRFFTPHRGF